MYLQERAKAMMSCKSHRSNKSSTNSIVKNSFRAGENGGHGTKKLAIVDGGSSRSQVSEAQHDYLKIPYMQAPNSKGEGHKRASRQRPYTK